MDDLLRDAAERAARYLAGLDARAVAPSATALADLAAFDTALPDEPTQPAEVLAQLDTLGSPADGRHAPADATSASSSAARCPRRWRPTGWPAPGTRTPRLRRHVAGRRRAGGDRAAAGCCDAARRCRRTAAARS